jgi:thiamine biosynthesis lipoprotein
MHTRELVFEAIGTSWTIRVKSAVPEKNWTRLERDVRRRIEQFDKTYSRFRSDSVVTQMAANAGTYQLPEDAAPMLGFYDQLYKATAGSVTPLIGQVMSDAGYDAQYSLRPKTLHQPPTWEEVIEYSGSKVVLKQPALLDFGAAGKGYLLDIVGEIFTRAGIEKFFVNAGGDILHRTDGNGALTVGLENPLDTTEVLGFATLHNKSMAASAGSRRKWSNYHHIIDPGSLESPREVLASWVIASDAMIADGVATALFFTAPVMLRRQFEFSYAILHSDMSLEYAKDFPVQIYEAEPCNK